MDKYNNLGQSDTSSDNADKQPMINSNSSSSQTETQSISLEKNSNQNESSDYQNSQNDVNHIDGFPLQGSQNHQSGDFVTPGYNNSNYNNTNYVSQNSISSNDQNAKNLAMISLICGAVSLLFACCCTCLGIPAAIGGIITGFMSNYDNGQKDGMAIIGIICSLISILIIIGVVIVYVASGAYAAFMSEV